MDFLDQHPVLITFICNAIFNGLFYTWLKMQVNRDKEKVKYEIQRKYMHVEIQTRNLLDIYPKLYRLVLEAGKLYIFADVISKKINEISADNKEQYLNEAKSIIQDARDLMLGEDLGLNEINVFTQYYELSSLFISDEINEIIMEIKQLFMDLYYLVKKEIANNKYQKYSYKQIMELKEQINTLLSGLDTMKYKLSRKMNAELNPY